MDKNEQPTVHPSGTRSSQAGQAGLAQIPARALARVGAVFKEGEPKHGRDNWKKGAGDPAYREDRLEHAIHHLHLYVNGDRSVDHRAKVAWAMLTDIELDYLAEDEQKKEPFADKGSPKEIHIKDLSFEYETNGWKLGPYRFKHKWLIQKLREDQEIGLDDEPVVQPSQNWVQAQVERYNISLDVNKRLYTYKGKTFTPEWLENALAHDKDILQP